MRKQALFWGFYLPARRSLIICVFFETQQNFCAGSENRSSKLDHFDAAMGTTIQTLSQVEDVTASTLSPHLILEPSSRLQRPWSSRARSMSSLSAALLPAWGSTVVDDAALAQVLKVEIMSMRSHLQLDSTSES